MLFDPLIEATKTQQWCIWEEPWHFWHTKCPFSSPFVPFSIAPFHLCCTPLAMWSPAVPSEQLLHFVHELMPRDVPWCSRAFWLRGRVRGGLQVRPWLCSQRRQVCGTERLRLRGQQWILSPCKLKHPMRNIHHIVASSLQNHLIVNRIVCLEFKKCPWWRWWLWKCCFMYRNTYMCMVLCVFEVKLVFYFLFVCAFLRKGMIGTWRAVTRSVSVWVEVWFSATTAAVNQALKPASWRTESTTVTQLVCWWLLCRHFMLIICKRYDLS